MCNTKCTLTILAKLCFFFEPNESLVYHVLSYVQPNILRKPYPWKRSLKLFLALSAENLITYTCTCNLFTSKYKCAWLKESLRKFKRGGGGKGRKIMGRCLKIFENVNANAWLNLLLICCLAFCWTLLLCPSIPNQPPGQHHPTVPPLAHHHQEPLGRPCRYIHLQRWLAMQMRLRPTYLQQSCFPFQACAPRFSVRFCVRHNNFMHLTRFRKQGPKSSPPPKTQKEPRIPHSYVTQHVLAQDITCIRIFKRALTII